MKTIHITGIDRGTFEGHFWLAIAGWFSFDLSGAGEDFSRAEGDNEETERTKCLYL